jgi:hypothetical protein
LNVEALTKVSTADVPKKLFERESERFGNSGISILSRVLFA